MSVATGADTTVYWIRESDYKIAASDPTPHNFGANGQLTTREAVNNGTRIYLPYSRQAVDIKAGTFEGSFAVDFALTNPWFFELLMGPPDTTDNGDGTHTHTFSMGEPTSFQLIEGYELAAGNDEAGLQGCVPATFTADPSVGQDGVVPCVLEGFYGGEGVDEDVTLTDQPSLSETPLDYGDARLDIDGTTQNIVQDASLSLTLDPLEAIQGFGSRFPIAYLAGAFTPSLDYSKIKQDTDAQQQVYGGSTSTQESVPNDAPLTLDFDNGQSAGSGMNQITFNGSGDFPESYGEEGPGDPTSAITENLSRMLQNVTVDATNETASPP